MPPNENRLDGGDQRNVIVRDRLMTRWFCMLTVVCGALLQVVLAAEAGAACGDQSIDGIAVTLTRMAADSTCDCAGATSRAAFRSCAMDVVASRVADGQLREDCARTARRCLRKSTCGRPGAVTCCRTTGRGAVRCGIKRDASRCRARRGGSACVGTTTSCCDGCADAPCIPTTTSTTSSTTTSTLGIPAETCGGATYPTCDGTCSGANVCGPVQIYTSVTGTVSLCACLDPTATCTGSFNDGMCPGVCPAGKVCYGEPEPAGLGNCVGCLPVSLPTTTSTITSSTTSSTIAPSPCGDTFPFCNGPCPAGEYCTTDDIGGSACICAPLPAETCGGATFPTCDGTCNDSGVCGPVRIFTFATGLLDLCLCLDPTATCTGRFVDGMCPGVCPAGTACYGEPDPAGLGNCLACLPLNFF
jgi:hypothetical protein